MVEESQPSSADGGQEQPSKPATRRRRRTPAAQASPSPADGATPEANDAAPPKRTTRRRRPPTEAEATEAGTGPSSDAPAAPARRRRSRKPAAEATAEPATPTSEADNPAEAPKQQQRRGRPKTEANADSSLPEAAASPDPEAAAPSVDATPEAETQPARSSRRRRGHRGGARRRQTAEQAVAGVPAIVEPEADWPDVPDDDAQPTRHHRHRPARNLSEIDATPSKTTDISFMHPSEREFANLLDYYHIKYLYEPRSFPIRWEGNRVAEMHTPDFYLPEYDQYFELTTMKQSLVTQKNRKLRMVKELYPEVSIQLLYRRDLMRLMGKYGFGPLAEVDVAGTERVLFSAEQVQQRVKELGRQITEDYRGKELVLIGVLRGVVVFMADLMRNIDLPIQIEFMEISHYGEEREEAIEVIRDAGTDIAGRHVVVVEDIVDTGLTLKYLLDHLRAKRPATVKICALLDKSVRRMARVPIDYVGFEIPDEFVIGYGLDYGSRYRNLPYIGVLKPQEPKAVAQR